MKITIQKIFHLSKVDVAPIFCGMLLEAVFFNFLN